MALQNLIYVGIILMVIAVGLIFVGSLGAQKSESKFAVGGFIGPFPFGFGNSPKMVWLAIGLSIIMMIVFLVLRWVR